VKFKLDENLPASSAAILASAGHDVDTVADEGLVGAPDQDVVGAATAAGRILVSLDRGLGDIRAYPPGSHAGIVVLRFVLAGGGIGLLSGHTVALIALSMSAPSLMMRAKVSSAAPASTGTGSRAWIGTVTASPKWSRATSTVFSSWSRANPCTAAATRCLR
jgi:predicted nuclease of predicted toxin-antitoxin system